MAKNDTVHDAQPGDSVSFRDRFGKVQSGPVIMKFKTHVTLGGKFRSGMVVDDSNFVSMRKGRNRRVQSDFVTKFM